MRITIREQLALLVLFSVLVALTIVSVPTWLYVNAHIANTLRNGLALTASLKASRITSELELIQTSCYTISSRVLLQTALQNFYTQGSANWDDATRDLTSALSIGTSTGLLQVRLYSRNVTGPHTGLLNITSAKVPEIILPYETPDGSRATLSDTEYGYPPMLYPNITYVDIGNSSIRPNMTATAAEPFPQVRISRDGGLLLGPLVLNATTALISVSVPIRDNDDLFILGYMTIVALATSLVNVRDSREGLDDSGMVLIIGPDTKWNRFPASDPASNSTYKPDKEEFGNVEVHFVLPPVIDDKTEGRHGALLEDDGINHEAFPLRDYSAALNAFADQHNTVNNASSDLDTRNEQDVRVAVGWARTQTPLANWTVIVEKNRNEAYQPIATLRNILLGTVFATAGALTLIIVPLAHFSVLPIRKLKAATEKSISPPGYEDTLADSDYDDETPGSGRVSSHKSKKGLITTLSRFMRGKAPKAESERDASRRMFKIPGKVDEGKHIVTDELTELTRTFNDMSDELVKQYTSLEEKVQERTRELSESKKAAEAANESKTLFIANISHELKTPLNGILGMCTVCMEETDLGRIKQSLKTLYESGDLLLHLLEDLLSFSKNQIGQQLTMEIKEFKLSDIRSQILAIFDKQVREGQIDFNVTFVNTEDLPLATAGGSQQDFDTRLAMISQVGMIGKLDDVTLWGDHHRILQVIINLVSNSLKFTPAKGKVEVRIKCLGEDHLGNDDSSRASSMSLTTSRNSRNGQMRFRGGSASVASTNSAAGTGNSQYNKGATALAINPMDPKTTPHVHVYERSPTPPPPGARSYVFEFEVEDTGPGIPESMHQKVFEPFVQGDLGLSRKFGGTGLGLSICHQLAGLMGGSITLKSTEGLGTTFTMHIPLKFAKASMGANVSRSQQQSIDSTNMADSPRSSFIAASTSKPQVETGPASSLNPQPRLVGLSQPYFPVDLPGPPTPSMKISAAALNRQDSQSKLKVLVADDNSTNIEVVSRMLKLEDVYDVTIAKDGQEAFDLVKGSMEKNESFDVIFMDVQMPNVDGLQSTRLIRGMGYKSPIVALTAFSEESNVKECIDSGMDEFLSKPIRRPALKQVLKRFATIPEEIEFAAAAAKVAPMNEKGNPDEKRRRRPRKADSTPNGSVHSPPTPPPTSFDFEEKEKMLNGSPPELHSESLPPTKAE
jgi:osomolarity two-component system sensor histidine kinase SLN1